MFEEELAEQVGSSVKQMLEQALEEERTARLSVGRYVRDVEVRRDYRNDYYQRDLGTRLGLLRGLRVMLVAYGITAQGCRKLLAYCLAWRESEAAWTAFLQDLCLRGLRGQRLRLVITDGATGLAAIGLAHPQGLVQRCWAHKLPNLADTCAEERRLVRCPGRGPLSRPLCFNCKSGATPSSINVRASKTLKRDFRKLGFRAVIRVC